jgi:hypothetical protein
MRILGPIKGRQRLASGVALCALPLLLALVGYYRWQLAGHPLPFPHGDAALYAYQLVHVAECHGAWWRLASDSRLGDPYPTEFAKHPGLFEGLDLMLLATAIAPILDSRLIYHAAVLAALAANGWVAAWLVWRTTRSFPWAALAVVLITLNQSVALRIQGHLHLFKFAWVLLAVASFVAYLEQPAWKRGVLVGLAAALVLASSFYLGFFLALGLAFWTMVEATSGRLKRGHAGAGALALLAFLVLAALFCFPVWTSSSPIVASNRYFRRDWSETWGYGSELWKYFVPMGSALANMYFRSVRLQDTVPLMDEGWHFPGYTVLFGLLTFAVGLLRKSTTWSRLPRFVSVSVGLVAFWTVLSLSGGPSVLIYHVVPSFRCYGRAGLFVVALGAVIAPMTLCNYLRSRRSPLIRVVFTIGVTVLAASDALRAALCFPGWSGEARPVEWAAWLKDQPPDLRLAVFPLPDDNLAASSGQDGLTWLPFHHHGTLSGADFALVEGDLALLGASYAQINPLALRFIVSLGYDALAFHRGYLAANPWIESLPWLDRVHEHAGWLICRASPRLARLPSRSLAQLLDVPQNDFAPRVAPPGRWVTHSWPVSEDLVVHGSDWAFLLWTDERGQPLSQPKAALYQHVFGPAAPAYSIQTPERPGFCRLVIQDRGHHTRASIPYQILPQLQVAQPSQPPRRSLSRVPPAGLFVVDSDQEGCRSVNLVNSSTQYLQSRVFRDFVDPSSRTHPGIRSRWPRANSGSLVLRLAPHGSDLSDPENVREFLVPQDLPPGGIVRLPLSPDRLPPTWAHRRLDVEPIYSGTGGAEPSQRDEANRIAIQGRAGAVDGAEASTSAARR